LLFGDPQLDSTRIRSTGTCGSDGFVERLEGLDSLKMVSQDLETPPEPGKPFDALVYQQVAATPGEDYSLSGWMVSLCGGSAIPNDCPQGYYIAKMLGIDPTGGTDPLAPSVLWVEDRRNFTESRWANLRMGTTALDSQVTLFARIHSPFRWHGAHAFLDAISLVQAPRAFLVDLPATVQGNQVSIRWDGELSPDIATIPGGTHELLFDVQYRRAGEDSWTDWQVDQPAGQASFIASGCAAVQMVEFRVRARAEQPPGSNGAWPNHRYPGVWSGSETVTFLRDSSCSSSVYLPTVSR
jgi:hypothetical protein